MPKDELSGSGVTCGRALGGCSTILGHLDVQGRNALVRCESLHCCALTHVHRWVVQLPELGSYRALRPGEREMGRA